MWRLRAMNCGSKVSKDRFSQSPSVSLHQPNAPVNVRYGAILKEAQPLQFNSEGCKGAFVWIWSWTEQHPPRLYTRLGSEHAVLGGCPSVVPVVPCRWMVVLHGVLFTGFTGHFVRRAGSPHWCVPAAAVPTTAPIQWALSRTGPRAPTLIGLHHCRGL